MLACVPQEIVYYAPFHDAYLVWHKSGIEAWFKKPLVEEALLEAYAEHRRKRKREDEEEAKLVKLMLESVSEEPQSITWGESPAHIKALQADGYMPGVKKDWQPKRDSSSNVYERYPPRAMLNGHNIPLLASLMPGVVINTRASMPTGTDDVPREVQEAIRAAIIKAFDALPFEERPENKRDNPDSFGQHKLNFDDSTHNFKTLHSYERLYLSPTPSQSQRGGSTKCSDGRSRSKR